MHKCIRSLQVASLMAAGADVNHQAGDLMAPLVSFADGEHETLNWEDLAGRRSRLAHSLGRFDKAYQEMVKVMRIQTPEKGSK